MPNLLLSLFGKAPALAHAASMARETETIILLLCSYLLRPFYRNWKTTKLGKLDIVSLTYIYFFFHANFDLCFDRFSPFRKVFLNGIKMKI